jgi:cob(I)alamin adenosyltransferase
MRKRKATPEVEMDKGSVYIYTGDGRGKSPAALGRAVQTAVAGGNVVIIQFLKGKGLEDSEFLRRLEPEIKLFRFEKSDENFEELTEERKQEEVCNIKNGICYAKKVLTTGECDLLILDEVLGLVEKGILQAEDLKNLLECRGSADVILTGINLSDDVCILADEVSRIETVKFKVWE